jgi:hypothetical protein
MHVDELSIHRKFYKQTLIDLHIFLPVYFYT